MIEVKKLDRDDLMEIRISGTVTDEDYRNILTPALDQAIERGERIRALVVLKSDLSDFTFGALMDDARLGLKHWRGFDRLALVTGSKAIKTMVKAFSVVIPCPVRVFDADETEDAHRWLVESLGAIHQRDLGDGVLHVQLVGALDSAVYEEESRDIAAFIARNDKFRLLLDLREFDGWQGLGAIGEHFRLVRDHAGALDRAAIVGDAGWQALAVQIGKRVIGKDARYFDDDEFAEAVDWLKT